MSTRSRCVTSRRSKRVKAAGPDVPSSIALGTSCLLPRSPRRCPCSSPKTSGRRWTSRPTLNDLVRYSAALWCLPQSCGHHPGSFGPGCSLGGVLSHHQHPTCLPRLPHLCRGGGGGRHPHHFCRRPRSHHPHGCGPCARDCCYVAVSSGCVPPTLPPGFGQKTGSGASSWVIRRALTRARVGAALVCPA